ncbi:MAG: phosphoglycerate dehydrogenase [Verrucomicrobia bacterium]|nr:phosphoglycerate dehydrogenase [Verrucomicrobiota bacterium]MCF7708676.1 phosphoglycerate dehydrogenase [Verrucomicrobiota bacterium]
MTFKVYISEPEFIRNCPNAIQRLKAAGGELIMHNGDSSPREEEMIECLEDADAWIAGLENITGGILRNAPRLKVISRFGVGCDNVDTEAAAERGITIAVTEGAMTNSVAELVFGLVLALARRIPYGDAIVRGGDWRRYVGVEISGKTLGIAGMGRIGRAVARRAKGFDMRVIGFDAVSFDSFAEATGIEVVGFERLVADSDFLSLHLPSTKETRGIIDAHALAQMKRSAFIVNTARGELVNETALAEALKRGQIAGAATDVFAGEPPVGSPLIGLENFIATPHVGSLTAEALVRMGEIAAGNVINLLRGDGPVYSYRRA